MKFRRSSFPPSPRLQLPSWKMSPMVVAGSWAHEEATRASRSALSIAGSTCAASARFSKRRPRGRAWGMRARAKHLREEVHAGRSAPIVAHGPIGRQAEPLGDEISEHLGGQCDVGVGYGVGLAHPAVDRAMGRSRLVLGVHDGGGGGAWYLLLRGSHGPRRTFVLQGEIPTVFLFIIREGASFPHHLTPSRRAPPS